MLREIVPVLIGGFCAALGGFLSMWYAVTKARKIRMEEAIGEKKVEVYREALPLISHLRYSLIEDIPFDSLKFVMSQEEWFWNSRAFLPNEFSDKWESVRINLLKAIDLDRSIQRSEKPDDNKVNELRSLELYIRQLAKEAERRIERELDLPPIKVHRLPKTKNPC